MSGKYDKKKKTAPRKRRKGRGILVALLYAILIASLIFIAYLETRDDAAEDPQLRQEETLPGEISAEMQETSGTESAAGLDLGSGVFITDFLPFTGAFMEDRTDEVVTDVLAIKVTNTGGEYIQLMDITLTAGEVNAEFSLSTLFPGETAVVLEKNRMAFSTAPEFTQAAADSVALFDGHPGMAEDKLEIQCLEGVINITNISGEDIPGDILVYYKNCISGIYYGGITYRLRVEGGLKAGEIRQGAAAHFDPSNSAVVFVTCG